MSDLYHPECCTLRTKSISTPVKLCFKNIFVFFSCEGSKRIYAGHFSRGTCSLNRFQPIIFWTNGSLSDCIFAKSKCNDEGQIVYNDMSPSDDISCTCDTKKSYSFLKTSKYNFNCIPTEEDCSCYIKSCPENSTLSAGILFLCRLLCLLYE